jgi:glycosyltransferase involved in cell wall biosynthesis
MIDWTLVIPAYNEEKRIRQALESLRNVFGKDLKIIVVSNGSVDHTVDILKEFSSKDPNLSYYDFPDKLGKGGAILEGFKYANTEFAGFIDADDAFDLNDVKRVINGFDSDVVIASKWIGRGFFQVTEPFGRKILSRGWNVLARVFLGLKYYDTQAGAKFFKKKCFDEISDDFICKNFSFDIELLYKFKKSGFKIKEVYVPSKHMEGSTFNMNYVWPMFKDLVKVWWKK